MEKQIKKEKSFRHKNWCCKWVEGEQMFYLYTPDEMDQPPDFRYNEFECETAEQCKEFINSY